MGGFVNNGTVIVTMEGLATMRLRPAQVQFSRKSDVLMLYIRLQYVAH